MNHDLLMHYAGSLGRMETALGSVKARLKAAAEVRTTAEGLRESIGETMAMIEREIADQRRRDQVLGYRDVRPGP